MGSLRCGTVHTFRFPGTRVFMRVTYYHLSLDLNLLFNTSGLVLAVCDTIKYDHDHARNSGLVRKSADSFGESESQFIPLGSWVANRMLLSQSKPFKTIFAKIGLETNVYQRVACTRPSSNPIRAFIRWARYLCHSI